MKHESGMSVVSQHGVRFAGTSRSIGEYSRIESVYHTLYQEFGRIREYRGLGRICRENHIKGVMLFFESVVEVLACLGVALRIEKHDDLLV